MTNVASIESSWQVGTVSVERIHGQYWPRMKNDDRGVTSTKILDVQVGKENQATPGQRGTELSGSFLVSEWGNCSMLLENRSSLGRRKCSSSVEMWME